MLYEDQQRNMQPYGYNMTNNLPTPMGGISNNAVPGLSSSMMTPNLNSQGFMPNKYQQTMTQYKKGGRAKRPSLVQMAEILRMQGEDDDKVLAHINPYEAAQLQSQSGSPSINPHTGLPQYGLGKLLRKAARFVLPVVGGMVGGPAGAAAGGGLGGLVGGGKNKWRNAVLGAGLGYAGSGGFGDLGGLGRIIPGIGQAGANGMGSLGAMFSGAGGGAGAAATGAGAGAGGLGDLLSGNGMNSLLMGGALLGTLGGKKRVPNEGSLAENIASAPIHAGLPSKPERPLERVQRILAEDEDEDGVYEKLHFEDVNPVARYAQGGQVEQDPQFESMLAQLLQSNGYAPDMEQRGLAQFPQYNTGGRYYAGVTGGQDDTINAKLSDGEYVISADVVSSLGDGNNSAGAKKLDGMMKSVRSHKTKNGGKSLPPKSRKVESYLSGRK